jgi:Domain of unknown function (DUF1844)
MGCRKTVTNPPAVPPAFGPATRVGEYAIVRAMLDSHATAGVALGPVDFSTHVLSLASTAMIALGKLPAPDNQPHPVDLETARHLIDVLAMLERKTKGNLEEAEAKLVASLIYDLRIAFVDVRQASPMPSAGTPTG